ncbi:MULTISPECIES: hypothetical protein [Weeksella]|uniref:hypothetical protein n=1 Tax=Weeksella TaxID=1013 RepID=UPI0008A43C8A|nr:MULTISPECIES: hypothetical protein [Weeksella]MDK7374195.1 hypothetical protein [Weeksella virosa]OFM82869.1 hypothetical protein HMPREF2660_04260 [Weeksella sp. HMSC059D05]
MFIDQNGNYKLKVAFDYDDTLTDEVLFQLAQRMIRKGHDVWILTVRTSNEQYLEHCTRMDIEPKLEGRNADLIADATALGIADKIIYTDSEDKLEFYQEHQFDMLFDDDADWHTNPICEAGGIGIHI